MRRSTPLFLMSLSFFALVTAAQDNAPPPNAEEPIDVVGQQATQLEAELGKYKDSSPEAAAVMLKLVDLYHSNGRVFGLTRVAQRFTAAQTNHAQHAAVMAKLLDGLEALSRNEDLIATCRQFLARYPESPQCAAIEIRLADTLQQTDDRLAAAKAAHAVWIRQPSTETGRQNAAHAIYIYSSLGSGENITSAAKLAEEVLEKLPAGPFSRQAGLRAVSEWARANQWAKSNVAGHKLLKKGVLNQQRETLRELHLSMATHYANLGQNANSVESLKQARAIRDDQAVHQGLIYRMNSATATPQQMEPIVNQYVQRYPDRPDRYVAQSWLANAYLRSENKTRGLAILAALLPFDAVSEKNAHIYLQNIPSEPAAKLSEAERVLLAAIGKNPQQAYYLRYVLAFELYRDRLKDVEKCRQTLRELVSKSPSDDSHSSGAMNWLLSNARDENEFRGEVARLIQARRQFIHMPGYRSYLAAWKTSVKGTQDKELKARARYVAGELAKANQDPLVALSLKQNYGNDSKQSKIRQQLMQPANLSRLGNDAARRLLGTEGYYMRHYVPAANRSKSTTAYGLLAKRFPQDYPAARNYLQSATDFSPPEVGKEAALNLLKFDPTDGNADTWRRLFVAADTAKDTAMVQQVYAWVMKSQQKFGKNSANASQIADILTKHKMEPQAVGYWNTYLTFDRNSTESRDCAARLLARIEQQPQRIAFMADLFKHDSDFHGRYASWLAHEYFEAKDLNNFVKVLQETRRRQNDRPFRGWDFDSVAAAGWVSAIRSNQEATVADRKRVYDVCEHLQLPTASAAAVLARLEITPADQLLGTARLLEYQRSTQIASNSYVGWDALIGYLQAAQARKDFVAAATLATGMLNNIAGVDETRRKSARNIVTQSYSRIGRVGLTIDENSPVAPLLQAALYLRLGDENLAHDAFLENKPLFDQHRNELPVDLIAFICERSMAAGGDENHDYVEEVLRGWLVKNSEAPQVESSAKAQVQLLLGRNYFKARRFDLARNEFTSTVNRYADTPQAIEAEFGIGESFMAQKVFDQAEQVFDKLARSRDTDVIVRAEFLRGVLAFRRGDRDEARDIFRGVLERVPNVKLANQALFNLAEVYGAEERYVDQLNLLRTVGRLGRRSKRLHTPGTPLSIVVHDSDLGISRGHNKIPVVVTTKPGGDTERMFLTSAGAGKGLFRVDVDTQLGQALPGDKILQLTGNDVIQCDYPDEFKAEFKNVPLSDVDIRVAASAEFEVSSSKIIDQEEETFSQQLVREAEREKQDQRVSQGRPANQIKPGNIIYLQVEDSDRDLSNDADRVIIKLTANSGDQVQVALQETGPHTGVFDGTAQTGELPAGALASDAAIGHSPLMAIDSDLESYWMSEPDGATPKHLTVDMKDLRLVSRVKLSSPGGGTGAPVRGNLFGSQDGQFWFRIASQPARPPAPRVVGDAKHMTRRIYPGGYTNYTNWDQVVALTKDVTPAGEEEANELSWKSQPDEDGKFPAFAVVWHGTLVQPRSGAARIRVQGAVTGLAVDGKLEMPVGKGTQSVDLWLDRGPHELTIFSASSGQQAAEATLARASLTSQSVFLAPFRATDFDLNEISTQVAQQQGRQPAEISALDDVWEFRFRSHEVRYVRLVVNEYRGEAVAINHIEIGGEQDGLLYIPTEEDVLSLSTNELLEIAAGDVVTATYTDEFTQNKSGASQLLTRSLTATYNNASVAPIAYNFVRGGGGGVGTERKDLKRVDPGERVTVEIIDFDQDQTNDRDTVRFQLIVNDGEAVMLTATETAPYSGVFTKEVDTTAEQTKDKLAVKRGDRIYIRYIDTQNTFPGHAVPREAIVYVNEPSEGQVRIYESRITPPPPESKAGPKITYSPPAEKERISGVAFETPLTVEVIDPDAAKDSRSSVTVSLATTDGARVNVECVISSAFGDSPPGQTQWALEEGRFVGQVLMQLGGKDSPVMVPLTADMPRSLIGRVKSATEEDDAENANLAESNLVTHVLNLTGKDLITASYEDALRPGGNAEQLTARGRLLSNGQLAVTDRDYEKEIEYLHVGEKLFLMVTDPDHDSSDERDMVDVEVNTERGEKETVQLAETLAHSGVFTASFMLKAIENPLPGNFDADDPTIESYFGDTLRIRYLDESASTEDGRLELLRETPVVIGTDGLVASFTKTFNDETLAVETKFRIAESYFELFKSHKQLEREEELKSSLESGRRVLREVMEDYPDRKYAPRIAYLLGQFAQELEQWDEAIRSYELILRQFPDHTLAADAQYKLAQSYEESGEFDKALEEYVTLAATYPKSPLISSVMIRISDYFYKSEVFEVSAQVGEKFLERFDGHEHAARMAFRVGQCYYKAKKYGDAGVAFDKFGKTFSDDDLAADAMFWAGESFRLGTNNLEAFRRYNRCRWDHPASEAAKYARGRLALPEMLQQFEADIASVDDDN